MALTVKHAKVSAIADSAAASAAGQVLPSDWNASHTITGDVSDFLANPTASVGLSAVNGSAVTAMRSDAAPALDQTAAYAFSGLGNTAITANGALSSGAGPGLKVTGTWVTGGSFTTTKPHVLIETAGATSNNWTTAGTGLGINAASGFTGNLIDAQLTGASKFSVDRTGSAIFAGSVTATTITFTSGNLVLPTAALFYWTNRTVVSSPVDATIRFENQAQNQTVNLTIPSNNTWQFGPANNVTPAGQTVQAQGSRAGTDTNVGGASITFDAGTGTGTGTIATAALRSPVAVASGTGAQTMVAGITAKAGTAVLTSYTVATLPAAATAGAGALAFVTDATQTAILGLGLAVAGGGANKVIVYSDATNWLIL